MSDESKEPEGQETESARPDEEENLEVREISDAGLEAQLKKHKEWLKSVEDESDEALERRLRKFMEESTWDERPGANFQSKKLPGEKFKAADLRWANFRRACLQNADFRRADLRSTLFFDADLRKADLRDADLARAALKDAKLNEARLFRATLREANLQDADLTKVKGLLAEQLAGANVSGATLPDDIAEFKGLDHVTEISKHARNIFLAVIGGCVFSWLTIATTTDAALLTNSASTPLPIIQTKVPIAGFYWAAPAILLGLYCYLHLYLQRMWEGLAGLPAIFPDGRTVDQRAYPWLLSGLVRAHVPLLKENRPPLSRLQIGISMFAAWVLVPVTLFAFWLRYLPRHEWLGTGFLIIFLLVSIWSGVTFYRLARATLCGHDPTTAGSGPELPAVLVGIIVTLGITASAINGSNPLQWAGYSTNASLRQADVSTKPANWSGKDEDIGLIKGANLQGKDLRFADGVEAFLVKADLREANLRKFDLENADLRGADLRDTNIVEASNIELANLQKANLQWANLQWANLQGANLVGAKLHRAMLQGANLKGAKLQGAKLQGAKLQVAKLQRANLQVANLQGANLKGANLVGAKLQRAKLRRANLKGGNLSLTNFEGAIGLTAKSVENACYQPKIGDKSVDKSRGPPINLPDDITAPPCKKAKEKNEAGKK